MIMKRFKHVWTLFRKHAQTKQSHQGRCFHFIGALRYDWIPNGASTKVHGTYPMTGPYMVDEAGLTKRQQLKGELPMSPPSFKPYLKGAGSRIRPQDNFVVLKLVDGVNPPQQLNWYLVGKCIAAHLEDLNVYETTDNNFASPNTLRFINSIYFENF